MTVGQRIAAEITKSPMVVVGALIISAFLGGLATTAFLHATVDSRIDDRWKGGIEKLVTASLDEALKKKYPDGSPAAIQTKSGNGATCARVNDVQFCWNSHNATPTYDEKLGNRVDAKCPFSLAFADDDPTVVLTVTSTQSQRTWVVYSAQASKTTYTAHATTPVKEAHNSDAVVVRCSAFGRAGQ